jgi:hypothetical protein
VTEQDVVEQIEAELEKLTVADVLLHTASTVASLAYRRLGEPDRDLQQVRLAIDSLQSLLPLLGNTLTEDVERDFRSVIANIQFAYADAVGRPVQ